jgi:hypothetical protein
MRLKMSENCFPFLQPTGSVNNTTYFSYEMQDRGTNEMLYSCVLHTSIFRLHYLVALEPAALEPAACK